MLHSINIICRNFVNVNVNVRHAYWAPLELTFISVAYARWCHWWCGRKQLYRLQPSVNLHAQLQPLCSVALSALVPNVLPRRDEGSGVPYALCSDQSLLVFRPPMAVMHIILGCRIMSGISSLEMPLMNISLISCFSKFEKTGNQRYY